MGDVLKVWVKERKFNEEELVKDFEEMFYSCSGEIILNGKKIEINKGEKYKSKISIKGFYYENGEMKKITLSVFH